MSKAITPQKRLRRVTTDGDVIYRPAQYPFEMVYANDVFVVQTDCFVDERLYNDDKSFIQTKMVTSEKDGADMFFRTWVKFAEDRNAAKDRGEPFTNPGALFMSRLKSIREALSVMPSGASAR